MKLLSRLWFSISDLNISGSEIPENVADKMLKWHIFPMSIVREDLGIKIWASKKSGWRPFWWERKNGRNGDSQHVFKLESKGAVDWTCENFKKNKYRLLNSMINNTEYKRFCIYETFIHADYKDTHNGKRLLFEYESNDDGKWKWNFIKFIKNEN